MSAEKKFGSETSCCECMSACALQVSAVQSLLECGICYEVAKEAVTPSCCDHLFCEEHLARWAARQNSCPVCKQSFSEARKTGAAKLAREMQECFRFPCPRRGCAVAVLRKDLSRHLELHDRVDEYRRKRQRLGLDSDNTHCGRRSA